MSEKPRITRTAAVRIAMLVVIAVICLASAVGWSDPDLWIPFVCIIAVMGVSTRGGVLDTLTFVLIEAAVVVVLGIATFSGSRDFIWAASVAVSLVAVGKIALLELAREDARRESAADEKSAAEKSTTEKSAAEKSTTDKKSA